MIELFDDIEDIWLWNWEKMRAPLKEGESQYKRLKWLIKKDQERGDYEKVSKNRFEKAFEKINDQYLVKTDAIETIERWRSLILMKMESRVKIAKGARLEELKIKKYDYLIGQLLGAKSNVSDARQRVKIERYWKQEINPKKTTLGKYLDIIEEVKEIVKESGNGGS